MSFISYAKYFEDVLLWRAFKSIENGFYIDAVINDPVADSATRAFYEHGWHGINIEKRNSTYPLLCNNRPGDINLLVPEICSGNQTDHPTEPQVQPFSLNQNLEKYQIDSIQFLILNAIEAEELFSTLNLNFWRPWIILVKMHESESNLQEQFPWESLIIRSGYALIYFDGINRFYVSAEHRDMQNKFTAPVNSSDDFVANGLKTRMDTLAVTRRELDAVKKERDQYQEELAKVYDSRSYRITSPLRYVFGRARVYRERLQIFLGLPLKRPQKHSSQKIARYFLLQMDRHPRVSFAARKMIHHFPDLKMRLKKSIQQIYQPGQNSGADHTGRTRNPMNREVRQIYWDLVCRLNKEDDFEHE